jgi:hypothetical protein
MRQFGLLQFARFPLPPLMMIHAACAPTREYLTSCFSLTWRLAAALNGVDEVLDLGDDCHEVNLLSRAKLMGIGAWNLGNVAVQLVEHHKWQRNHLWTRFLSSSRLGAFACVRGYLSLVLVTSPKLNISKRAALSPYRLPSAQFLIHSTLLVLLQHESLGSHA